MVSVAINLYGISSICRSIDVCTVHAALQIGHAKCQELRRVRPRRAQMGHCWSSHGDKRDERA